LCARPCPVSPPADAFFGRVASVGGNHGARGEAGSSIPPLLNPHSLWWPALAGLSLLSGPDRRPSNPDIMTKGAYTLSDIDWPMVRLYCSSCHRFAQFRRAALLQRFGPAKVMPSML